jgi:hypothetical protein
VTFGESGSQALYSTLLLAPFALLPVMAWMAACAGLSCCRCCCCRRLCNCARPSCIARVARAFNEVLFRTFRLELWFAALLSAGACWAASWREGRLMGVAAAACLAGAAWPLLGGAPSLAETAPFPNRPVRIVVPYSVGIGPDVVARALAQQLSVLWGQPVRVDNKPGASGILAFAEVRLVPADGHTLFVADTATLAVNPLLHATLPYDPQRDLAPLSLLFQATLCCGWVAAAASRRWGPCCRRRVGTRVGELCDAGQRPRQPCGGRDPGPRRRCAPAARALQGGRQPVHRGGQG